MPARPADARIELVLPPSQADAVCRLPGITAAPATPIAIAWHDTPDGTLAGAGLALSVSGPHWSLDTLHAANPLVPPGPLRQEDRRELLGADVPAATVPYATFSGTRTALRQEDTALTLVHGRLDGGAMLCRVVLEGPAASLHPLAASFATGLHAEVPRTSLAAQANTLAGRPILPGPLGAPALDASQDVADALAHILQHLGAVMLHWADRIPARTDAEPVHQMRVATRRLRSALAVFRHVAPCPALAAPAKDLAARLGAARDWDVFLDGTGTMIAHAFPDDPRPRALLRAAHRARTAAYDSLCATLDSPDFRTFAMALATTAALRPWPDSPALHAPAKAFGAEALDRRMRHVRHAGRGIAGLPVPALHELRKDCKRLRYTAEFFAPLFPGHPGHPVRRFTRRLAALQEELGLLNDGAAVAGLLAQLGRHERGYAAGLATGLSAAAAGPARGRIEARWHRFRAAEPFWAR